LRHQKCLYNLSETYTRLSKRRRKAPAVEIKHPIFSPLCSNSSCSPVGVHPGNSRDSTASDIKRAKEKEVEDRELVKEVEKEMIGIMKQYRHPPVPADIMKPIEFNYTIFSKPTKQYRRPKVYIKCLSDLEPLCTENDLPIPVSICDDLDETEVPPPPRKREVIATPPQPLRSMRPNRKKRKVDPDQLDGLDQRSQFITPRKSGRKRWFKDPDLRDEPPPLRHLLDLRPRLASKLLLAPAQEVFMVQKRVAELKLRCLALRCQQIKLRSPSSLPPTAVEVC